jgi:hypothetical protein
MYDSLKNSVGLSTNYNYFLQIQIAREDLL